METINHADMVRTLAKSGDAIASELTGPGAHLLHMAVGISGEVAELYAATGETNAIEELGDIEFYVEGLRQGLDVTREAVMATRYTWEVDLASMVVAAGEILDQVKKSTVYNKPLDLPAVMAGMLMLEHGLDLVRADWHGITREQTLEANIAKLGERYNGFKYSDKAAQERADKPGEA